jgi:SAM-dependent methyltransferase
MRRCLLVLAAAAAFDESLFDPDACARGLEHACAYGPPPAKAAVALPLLHEPRVKLWWPALDDVVEIAQDSSEPYDAPTTLWPAGAVLAHALASDCASWQGKVILELGCGVGAAALALARCGASVVATDISEAALALAAENTNGTVATDVSGATPELAAENTNGTVVTRLLDWDDDAALREVLAEGPFFAVVGAALKFEDWPVGRLDAVLGVLDPTVVVLAHAWADDDVEDLLGDPWRRAASFAGAAVGLEEFSAVTWVRRAPDL